MSILLFVFSLVAFGMGLYIFSLATGSNSALHEIEAMIMLLIAAILFVGAAIVDAIYGVYRKVKKESAKVEKGAVEKVTARVVEQKSEPPPETPFPVI